MLASRTEWLCGVLAFPRAAQVVAGGMKLRSGLEASWKKSRICPPLLATVCLENAETVFRCPRVSAPWMSYSNVPLLFHEVSAKGQPDMNQNEHEFEPQG